MLAPRTPRPAARRGAILLVVLVLLALFAVVGLGAAMYSAAEATAARIKREAIDSPAEGIDPTPFVNSFLRQMIYPVGDTGNDLTSAMRGHELSRLMYGWNTRTGATNLVPYNGVGTFFDPTFPGVAGITDRRQVVYYGATTSANHIIDPEHTGSRNPGNNEHATDLTNPPATRFFMGKNPGYTYPDRNNMAVAVVNPATGEVIVPSYHRPTLFNAGRNINGANNAAMNSASWLAPPQVDANNTATNLKNHDGLGTNSEWLTPAGRYKILRPRPEDQRYDSNDGRGNVTDFPYPPMNPDGTYTGDVQNYRFMNGPQKNDSIWMWANMPVVTWKGKQVTALVAPLVIPLDGSVNLTVAGNLKGSTGGMPPTPTTASLHGFGPWEINPSGLLPNTNTTPNPPRPDPQAVREYLYGSANPPAVRGTTPAVQTANFHRMQYTPLGPMGMPLPPAQTDVIPQDYARVNWDAVGSTNPMRVPGSAAAPAYRSDPSYLNEYDVGYGNGTGQTAGTEGFLHPALFNPYQWKPGSSPAQLFAARDFWRLRSRYSTRASTYAGTTADPFLALTYSGHSFEGSTPNHPANARRALVTTISNSLARPVLGVNFTSETAHSYRHVLGPGGSTVTAYNTATSQPQAPAFNQTTVTGGAVTDLLDKAAAGGAQPAVRSLRAWLGAVNLNRPLTDYRINPTLPLADPVNRAGMAVRAAAADADRQQLARDIFARLVVVTGAKAVLDPATGQLALPQPTAGGMATTYTLTGALSATGQAYTYTATQEEYDALRYLAQLAANIVDYIDPDDVSTGFVWNPPTGATPGQAFRTAEIGNRVVFGVEKPRLVINEAYSEVANNAADRGGAGGGGQGGGQGAQRNFEVRFWIELLNPGNVESNPANPTDPARALDGPDPAQRGSVPLRFATNSVYRIEVYRNGQDVRTSLNLPANVRGEVFTAMGPASPDIRVDATRFQVANAANPATLAERVEPNNGQPSAVAGTRNGFAVVGPQVQASVPPMGMAPVGDFAPDYQTDPLFGMTLITPQAAGGMGPPQAPTPPPPSDELRYGIAPTGQQQIPNLLTSLQDHGIVLRRLANPYLPPNDPDDATTFNALLPVNQYVTVDVMSQVQARNALQRAAGGPGGGPGGGGPPGAPPGQGGGQGGNTGQEQMSQRYSIGRVQPLCGQIPDGRPQAPPNPVPNQPTPTPHYTYPQSLTVPQQPQPPRTNQPQITLFAHNSVTQPPPAGPAASDATLQLPFEWFTHLDRRVVNQAELIHVSAVKPHEVTLRFAAPPTGMGVTPATRPTFHLHLAQWLSSNAMLSRALEALTVKPWTYGLPDGGRVAGRVNVNMIWDPRVLAAILDPQAGNGFTTTDVYDPNDPGKATGPTSLWYKLFDGTRTGAGSRAGTRTKNFPNVSDTIDENPADPATADRPFRSFGSGTFRAETGGYVRPDQTIISNTQYHLGVEDTILRAGGTGQPLFTLPPPNPNPTNLRTHPYQQYEPLRKAMNNLTTVSDTYLVLMTVGYFEVRGFDSNVPTGISRPILGKEVYAEIPGDMRVQFAAVVDRTQLALADPSAAQPQQADKLFFAELADAVSLTAGATTATVTVRSDGTVTTSDGATALVVNYEGRAFRIRNQPTAPTTLGADDVADLYVGAGGDAVKLTVTAVTYDTTTGIGTITAAVADADVGKAGVQPIAAARTFPGGTVVGSAVLGNPGPQPAFDPAAAQYKGVVPLLSRLTP